MAQKLYSMYNKQIKGYEEPFINFRNRSELAYIFDYAWRHNQTQSQRRDDYVMVDFTVESEYVRR